MKKSQFDHPLSSLESLLPQNNEHGSVNIFRDRVDENLFLIRWSCMENNTARVVNEKVRFAVTLGAISFESSWQDRKSNYLSKSVGIPERLRVLGTMESNLAIPNNFVKIALEELNEKIRGIKVVRALARRNKQKNKVTIQRGYGSQTLEQKITTLYRTGRQSGTFKKNTVVLKEKLDKFKKESSYLGEIEVIDATMESYTMRVIDFVGTEYVIFVLTNNSKVNNSETILLRLADKTDITQLVSRIRGYDLLKVKGYSREVKQYTNFVKLYEKELDRKLSESWIHDYVDVKKEINDKVLSISVFVRKPILRLDLKYLISPTNGGIEFQTNLNNTKRITAIGKLIEGAAELQAEKEIGLIGVIYDIEHAISTMVLTKDHMEAPKFNSIKQLITWLKLKKIEILF